MKLKQTYDVCKATPYSREEHVWETYEDKQVAEWEAEKLRKTDSYYVVTIRPNTPLLLQELFDCDGLAEVLSWVRLNVGYPDDNERLVWLWYETAYKHYVVQKTVETSHSKALEDVKVLVSGLDVLDGE